ncbi:GIY-YIG nuclease family protein [Patescibacteria group bacterium]|nr:GIY-YIG nuclease family protein [Patescibacteria group bacterium]
MNFSAKKIKLKKENLKKVPSENGVYIFWNGQKPIYIGKSVNLKNRLQSYFSSAVLGKTKQMILTADAFSIIKVASELEALLLEAKLVSNIKPKFNSQLRDDKHPLFILITKEKYPRVLTARKKDLNDKSSYFGPFPSSRNVRDILKLLRRIFPYAQHKVGKGKCFYSQIGLCNPCPNEIEKEMNESRKAELKKTYIKNVRMIKQILLGKFNSVKNNLEKDMEKFAKNEEFEKAAEVRKQIERLDYITQPITPINYFLKNPNFLEDVRKNEIDELKTTLIKNSAYKLTSLRKIECYDVAHLAGSYPTASMVTFIDGEPDKSLYRHFRIHQKKGTSDTDSLREAIKRRINHFDDWGIPDLIIVDGGKPQVSVFLDELKNHDIPVVGLAKKNEALIIPKYNFWSKSLKPKNKRKVTGSGTIQPVGLKHASTCRVMQKRRHEKDLLKTPKKHEGPPTIEYVEIKPTGNALNLVQRLRDEAHRFARRYHHKLLQKEFLQ